MKFIINVFENTRMYEVAYKMNGNVVNKKETLIIISANTEYDLKKEMKAKFPDLDFDSEILTTERYDSDGFTADKMINWGELSRQLVGDRTVVSRNRTPNKHKVSVERLMLNIETWYDTLRPQNGA